MSQLIKTRELSVLLRHLALLRHIFYKILGMLGEKRGGFTLELNGADLLH